MYCVMLTVMFKHNTITKADMPIVSERNPSRTIVAMISLNQ